jgi:uncharacterized phage protein gp47/JayE
MSFLFPTVQDLRNIALSAFQGYSSNSNVKLSASKLTEDGSDLNLVVNAGVGMADETLRQLKLAMQANIVATATGADLDTLAWDRFQLTRKPQSFATVLLVFTRPNATAGGGTIPAGTQISTVTGIIFELIYDVVFGASDLTQNGYGLASVSGPGANGLLPTTINTPLTAFFDSTITVSNPYVSAGGSLIETDAQFIFRIRNFYMTQQRGTLNALMQGALTVAGVYNAYAYDVIDPITQEPFGESGLIIADQNGNSTQVMINNVVQTLLNYKAAGNYVNVIGGTVSLVSITIHVSYMSGIDSLAAQQLVRNAIVAAVNNLGPGQTLYLSSIISAAASVSGVIVGSGAVTVPAGDVVPSIGQVLRTNGSLITFA